MKVKKVKCEKCGHPAEIMDTGDPYVVPSADSTSGLSRRSAWKCNCGAGVGPDNCRCDHLNLVDEGDA
jgi:hypothetical protein